MKRPVCLQHQAHEACNFNICPQYTVDWREKNYSAFASGDFPFNCSSDTR